MSWYVHMNHDSSAFLHSLTLDEVAWVAILSIITNATTKDKDADAPCCFVRIDRLALFYTASILIIYYIYLYIDST